MTKPMHVNEKTLAAIKGSGPSLDQRSARHCWSRARRRGEVRPNVSRKFFIRTS